MKYWITHQSHIILFHYYYYTLVLTDWNLAGILCWYENVLLPLDVKVKLFQWYSFFPVYNTVKGVNIRNKNLNNLITKQSHIGSLSPKLPRIAFHLIYWILYRETLLWENPLACQNTTDYDVDALTCLNCTFISINSRQKAFDCRCVCGVFKTFFFWV